MYGIMWPSPSIGQVELDLIFNTVSEARAAAWKLYDDRTYLDTVASVVDVASEEYQLALALTRRLHSVAD